MTKTKVVFLSLLLVLVAFALLAQDPFPECNPCPDWGWSGCICNWYCFWNGGLHGGKHACCSAKKGCPGHKKEHK